MQRKTAREQCERIRNLDPLPLKQQCARFVAGPSERIAPARPGLPAALNDRAADIWKPLLVIAALAGGDWPQPARQAAVALSASAEDQNPAGSFLLDILLLFSRGENGRLFTRTLIDGLNSFIDRPWSAWTKNCALMESVP